MDPYDAEWLERHTERSFRRLLRRLEVRFPLEESTSVFWERLEIHFPRLCRLYLSLYQDHYDFFYHLEELLVIMLQAWIDRSLELKALDVAREADPLWHQSEQVMGGVFYVDRFAGDLDGIREKIPYFKELGLTYLHLMPLYKVPEGENDGGYAVSSYREVNPALGSMDGLRQLAAELRCEGVSLVLDFVFNHTADEHRWAMQAKAGDPDYQENYRMFPDRTMPDAYDAHLREIFPDEHPGAFTYFPKIDQWVWTTFHSYQWDLNYANPVVFNRMAKEMLFLANIGVEVLRLDAVAFTWKRLGTDCENLPEAHRLIQAYNAVARIAAPALLFKSEAIVHPDEVARYIDPEECQLSYNPLLMALLWEALATREVRLLRHSMQKRFQIDERCTWVNYVRCHDDIGWTFSDEDAAELHINGFDHRQFLNAFYSGAFEGSFACGLPFQYNPATKDMRISGTCASLAGLEKALREGEEGEIELAIRRILLIHGVILSIGGVPLIYLGDEIGTLNDYGYRDDPDKADDSRWVHRPEADEEKLARRREEGAIEHRIYAQLRRLIDVRKETPAFAVGETAFVDLQNPHVFGYVRRRAGSRVLILANFIESAQAVTANELRMYGLGYAFMDLITGEEIKSDRDLLLEPYRFMWLA